MPDRPQLLYDRETRALALNADVSTHLSHHEDAILIALAPRRGHPLPHDRLITAIYADREEGIDPLGILQMTISRMRRRLVDIGFPRIIEPAIGRGGYMLMADINFVQQDSTISLGPKAIEIIKRLIRKCPDSLLAEEAKQEIFGA